jgi:hypothetical protein
VNLEHICAQRVRRRGICLAPCANGHVERRTRAQRGQQVQANELAKAALERVPIYHRMLMPRHDDPNTGKPERGSENSRIEVHGPNSLPLSNDGL